jgi:hypothetical protein
MNRKCYKSVNWEVRRRLVSYLSAIRMCRSLDHTTVAITAATAVLFL